MGLLSTNYSITELSDLTGVSRPTFYSYYKSYKAKDLDKVPYSFIGLFRLIDINETMVQIKKYCVANFLKKTDDNELNELIDLLKIYKDHLDINKYVNIIKEDLKNEQ